MNVNTRCRIPTNIGSRMVSGRLGLLSVLALAFVALLLDAGGIQAAEHPLFLDAAPAVDALPMDAAVPGAHMARRHRAVALNPLITTADGLAEGDTLRLSLFDDRVYTAVVDRIAVNVNGTVTVRARLHDHPLGYLLISTTGGRSLASIRVPERAERYAVTSAADELAHYVLDVDIKRLDALECGPPLILPDPPADDPETLRIAREVREALGPMDPAAVDVMIVYTPAATIWAGGAAGIANVIAQAMEKAQLSLDNSATYMTVNLVHSAEVAYVESGDSVTDLGRLTATTDGHMDEVHPWRDEHGADLVALFAQVSDVGGVAYLLTNPAGNPGGAFSLTRVQQAAGTYTHVHETGHNMGLHHHKEQNFQPGPGLFSYSAGWRWVGTDEGRYCSVLTYESGSYFPDGQSHTRVAHVSNPDINHEGVPTGHAEDGDNARTLREIKHVIAAYRTLAPVLATGSNGRGQLGLGDTTNRERFTEIEGFGGAVAVAAGTSHTLAIRAGGDVWACGDNYYGQLGMADDEMRTAFADTEVRDAVAVAAGDGFSLVLKTDGTVWACGRNDRGQLGLGNTQDYTVFHQTNLQGIKAIACGAYHSLALDEDGYIWSTGRNEEGQLGLGDWDDRNTFTKITGYDPFARIAAGAMHSLARMEMPRGSYWACGLNSWGQLGLGETDPRSNHNDLRLCNGLPSTGGEIACGWQASFVVLGDGRLFAAGKNDGGQLGLGDAALADPFTEVPGIADAVQATSGYSHTIVLDTQGQAWGTGRNVEGQLGLGTTENHRSFVGVPSLANGQRVCAGSRFTVALAEAVAVTHTLSVNSLGASAVAIVSTTGHGGTTDYTHSDLVSGTSVNLEAPPTDPTGYAFVRWRLDGVDQPVGQKTLDFSMPPTDITAEAGYQVLEDDFGDAPAVYPTLLVDNGARHKATGLTLGTSRDSESDGQPTPGADGDDVAGTPDDEDGVTFGVLWVGQTGASITVHVEGVSSTAYVDVWIDFSADGDWEDASEQVADSITVADGDNIVTFDVPSGAATGDTYARVRLSSVGDLAPDGFAVDGEVEDYVLSVGTAPDTFYVNDDSLVGDVYCTAVGNDANDGLAPDRPKRNIQAVFDAYVLGPGNWVLVDTGEYGGPSSGTRLTVTSTDSGGSGNPLQLIGPRSMGGRAVVASDGWCFSIEQDAHDLVIRGFDITGYDIVGSSRGVHLQYCARVEIRNNVIDGKLDGIVMAWNVNEVDIASCVVHRNDQYGIYVERDSMTNVRVTNTTIADNGSFGIRSNLATSNAADCSVKNSVLWGNADGPVSDPLRLQIDYSDIEGGAPGDHNIDENPLFANAAGGDYQLSAGSLCIDTADGSVAPTSDIDGNPRHDDTGMPNSGIGPPWADMGAYEFQGTSASLECIIDNKDDVSEKYFHVLYGDWRTNNAGTVRWDPDDPTSDYRWEYSQTGPETARAEWVCTCLPAGEYEVFAWWLITTYSMGQNVAYEVHHADGVTTVRNNQGINGGQWNSLGTFTFDAGSHVVQIHNGEVTSGKYVVADAVKFVSTGGTTSTTSTTTTSSSTTTTSSTNTTTSSTTTSSTTTTTTLPGTECIIDNKDAAADKYFQTLSGSWRTNNGGTARWDPADPASDYRWEYAQTGPETGRAQWVCTSLPGGTYEVFAWWLITSYSMGQNVAYEVHHADGVTTVRNNQGINGGQWNSLGTYTFNAGSHVVQIHNGEAKPGTYVVADAVKFVLSGGTTSTTTTLDTTTTTTEPTTTTTTSSTTTTSTSSTTTSSTSTTTTTTLPGTECIIDNKDAATDRYFQALSGSWRTNNGGTARWDPADPASDYRWEYAQTGPETGRAQWVCTFLPGGTYEVFAWWLITTYSMGQNVAYEVHHADGVTTVRNNQGINGGQWNSLGTYTFNAGSHVMQIHNGEAKPGTYVVADAVKFVSVATP